MVFIAACSPSTPSNQPKDEGAAAEDSTAKAPVIEESNEDLKDLRLDNAEKELDLVE
jgi:hypothetical protein